MAPTPAAITLLVTLLALSDAAEPPAVDAGPDRSVWVGHEIALEGAGPGRWSIAAAPRGSAAVLRRASAARCVLVVDRPGTYRVRRSAGGTFDEARVGAFELEGFGPGRLESTDRVLVEGRVRGPALAALRVNGATAALDGERFGPVPLAFLPDEPWLAVELEVDPADGPLLRERISVGRANTRWSARAPAPELVLELGPAALDELARVATDGLNGPLGSGALDAIPPTDLVRTGGVAGLPELVATLRVESGDMGPAALGLALDGDGLDVEVVARQVDVAVGLDAGPCTFTGRASARRASLAARLVVTPGARSAGAKVRGAAVDLEGFALSLDGAARFLVDLPWVETLVARALERSLAREIGAALEASLDRALARALAPAPPADLASLRLRCASNEGGSLMLRFDVDVDGRSTGPPHGLDPAPLPVGDRTGGARLSASPELVQALLAAAAERDELLEHLAAELAPEATSGELISAIPGTGLERLPRATPLRLDLRPRSAPFLGPDPAGRGDGLLVIRDVRATLVALDGRGELPVLGASLDLELPVSLRSGPAGELVLEPGRPRLAVALLDGLAGADLALANAALDRLLSGPMGRLIAAPDPLALAVPAVGSLRPRLDGARLDGRGRVVLDGGLDLGEARPSP